MTAHELSAGLHGSESFARLPIFDGVAPEVVAALTRRSSVRHYAAGAIILRAGDPVADLHVIRRGMVDLAHIDGEHECGVLLLSAMDLLFPSATMFDEPALVSARALTFSKLVIIERAAVDDALRCSLPLASNLMKAVSGQWRMAVRNILDLNCRTAAQRVGAFLLRMADLQPSADGAFLPIPKKHVAARLGMTAETLSRAIQIIARHGLYLRGRRIIVRDRTAIEAFCGPDPYVATNERALDVFAF